MKLDVKCYKDTLGNLRLDRRLDWFTVHIWLDEMHSVRQFILTRRSIIRFQICDVWFFISDFSTVSSHTIVPSHKDI